MRTLRVYKKTVSIVDETAVGLYETIAGGADDRMKVSFLLESSDKNNGRYTFMGVNPKEILTVREGALVVRSADREEILQGNPLVRLKEYYNRFTVLNDNEELAFTGGLVGNLGYDFVRYTEKLPDDNPAETGIEAIQFMLVTEFLIIDHVAETLTAVTLEADDEQGMVRAEAKNQAVIDKVRGNYRQSCLPFRRDGKIVKKSDTPQEYCNKVEKIKAYIREGHIFQTVLSQRWTIETAQKGFELYKELRKGNPSPYMYYFNYGDFEVIGSSPEMLVKQTERHVYTCPIAGTRPRGRDTKEDEALEAELLSDEKEKAEHVMLVDLARNDMGRIAKFGTVKVSDFMKVQKYSHVMHIVSMVEGRRKEGIHPLDLAVSFLPAGTLSGAPKIRAMEIIDELETVKRELYGGATGYIDFNGNMDFCITIRTMIKKGSRVYLQAGAGIVADSNPMKEYQECCNKGMALAKTLVETIE